MTCKSCQEARERALASVQYANPPINPSNASQAMVEAMSPMNRENAAPPTTDTTNIQNQPHLTINH